MGKNFKSGCLNRFLTDSQLGGCCVLPQSASRSAGVKYLTQSHFANICFIKNLLYIYMYLSEQSEVEAYLEFCHNKLLKVQ